MRDVHVPALAVEIGEESEGVHVASDGNSLSTPTADRKSTDRVRPAEHTTESEFCLDSDQRRSGARTVAQVAPLIECGSGSIDESARGDHSELSTLMFKSETEFIWIGFAIKSKLLSGRRVACLIVSTQIRLVVAAVSKIEGMNHIIIGI